MLSKKVAMHEIRKLHAGASILEHVFQEKLQVRIYHTQTRLLQRMPLKQPAESQCHT
jgi:hypothetical protein